MKNEQPTLSIKELSDFLKNENLDLEAREILSKYIEIIETLEIQAGIRYKEIEEINAKLQEAVNDKWLYEFKEFTIPAQFIIPTIQRYLILESSIKQKLIDFIKQLLSLLAEKKPDTYDAKKEFEKIIKKRLDIVRGKRKAFIKSFVESLKEEFPDAEQRKIINRLAKNYL